MTIETKRTCIIVGCMEPVAYDECAYCEKHRKKYLGKKNYIPDITGTVADFLPGGCFCNVRKSDYKNKDKEPAWYFRDEVTGILYKNGFAVDEKTAAEITDPKHLRTE